MELIDSHAHIYLPEFEERIQDVLEKAGNENVTRILLPAIDSATHDSMLKLEQQYSQCIAMMGVHPCSIKGNYRDELRTARDHFDHRKFCAVGEIGLDFYWDKTYSREQYKAFHEQIEWALHYDIPIVIHSRDATDECIEVVKQHQSGKLRGVFHCFSGNRSQADEIIKLGFYMGIGGVLTFKNSGLDKALEGIDPAWLILETDSPYLAPVPFRGKTNEPSYLKYVVEKLAGVLKMEKELVAEITSANAKHLFAI